MQPTKPAPQISLSVFRRAQVIFNKQNWGIETVEEDSTFDDFCNMLSFLDSTQQDCILDLTERFLRIDVGKYLYHIRKALRSIDSDTLKNVSTVYVLPLLPKEDYGKSKSSTFLTGLFRSRELRSADILSVKSVFILDRVDEIKQIINTKKWFLLLVDDFIGSGDTAEKALMDFIEETDISSDKIAVLSLVAQKIGYERLVTNGVRVYYSELRARGITDEYADPKRQDYLDIMMGIENMLKVKSEYRFGYQKSEALVTLKRTPNNTFPVFWLETHVKGRKFTVPFPR